jgi:hypothetical protein
MAKKKSKPSRRQSKPVRVPPTPRTDAGGTWSRGTGQHALQARVLHNKALAAGAFRPRGQPVRA